MINEQQTIFEKKAEICFLNCQCPSLHMYILFIVNILSDFHNNRILVMFKIVPLFFPKKRFGHFLLTILVRTFVITFIAEYTTCVSK
jgi:hypothetical protein